MALATEVPGAI